MFFHNVLTFFVNVLVYVMLFGMIVTIFSLCLNIRNEYLPIGWFFKLISFLGKQIGTTLGKLFTWLFKTLLEVLKVLFKWCIRLIEFFFEFIGNAFRSLLEIIQERRA